MPPGRLLDGAALCKVVAEQQQQQQDSDAERERRSASKVRSTDELHAAVRRVNLPRASYTYDVITQSACSPPLY